MANLITRRTAEAVTTGGKTFSEEHLRDWCWAKNKQAKEAGWAFWISISKDKETGSVTTKSRQGSDALDVIRLIEGWYPNHLNWDADSLASEFRILRHIARYGMPEEAFQSIRFASPPRQLVPA